jgi:hypothetical protein
MSGFECNANRSVQLSKRRETGLLAYVTLEFGHCGGNRRGRKNPHHFRICDDLNGSPFAVAENYRILALAVVRLQNVACRPSLAARA